MQGKFFRTQYDQENQENISQGTYRSRNQRSGIYKSCTFGRPPLQEIKITAGPQMLIQEQRDSLNSSSSPAKTYDNESKSMVLHNSCNPQTFQPLPSSSLDQTERKSRMTLKMESLDFTQLLQMQAQLLH